MKVLFDHQIFLLQKFGGISRYHYKLLQSLRTLFQENTFDIAHKGTSNFYLDGDKKTYNFRGRARMWNFINQGVIMRQINRYDILHPTYYNPYFLKSGRPVRYALTVHDMIPERELQNGEKQLSTIVQNKKRLIENASAIIAISEATKADILHYTNTNPDKIAVIYHGGPDRYDSVSDPLYVNTLPQAYFLYVGEREGYKNFLQTLEALAPLLRKEQLCLIAAGGKLPAADELSAIGRLHLTAHVQFRQNLTEAQLLVLYQNAVCFIYPSLMEGFGIPLLEAFSAGCPVLCSGINCFTEIAQDAALFFQPNSVGDLRSAAQKLYECEQLQELLKEKGKNQLAKFSWQKTAMQTHEVYSQMLIES